MPRTRKPKNPSLFDVKEEKEKKSKSHGCFYIGPPKCLECMKENFGVKTVDVIREGSDIPERTRMCEKCLKGVKLWKRS